MCDLFASLLHSSRFTFDKAERHSFATAEPNTLSINTVLCSLLSTMLPSSPSSQKRKALTLEERIKVIERNKKGENAISIARSLDVGKTQILNIVRERDSILSLGGRTGKRVTSSENSLQLFM